MDEKMRSNEEIEIDLQRVVGAVVKKAWLIGLVAIICAVATLVGTILFITPQYQAKAMFYVNNNSLSLGEASLSITSSDISASKSLVNTYIVILKTRESLNDVIDYAGVDRTYGELVGMIAAESVNSTEIFQVVVTSPDPAEAEKIANAIAYILPKRISSIIEGTSAKVVDSAVLPGSASSPNYTKNTMIGFVVGLVLMAAIIAIREILDVTIRTEEDVAHSCAHPVLAAVPDMNARSKGSYYSYGGKGAYAKKAPGNSTEVELVGGKISFAAAESYRLLRTKLLFSFADEGDCRVIGVSSALVGEGKSLTAVNLAYAMSQLAGTRVLLIDCDMRRPSVPDKIPVKKAPGLSDYLSGQIREDYLFQKCGMVGAENAFDVISAGRMPPNPMELLSSDRMQKLVDGLRGSYDYIILDLPPVGAVSDALAVSKLTDGMLLVVRQNFCDRNSLGAAVQQLHFMEAKILGIVFNGMSEDGAKYSSRYYKEYYKRYDRRYYQKRSASYPVDLTAKAKGENEE